MNILDAIVSNTKDKLEKKKSKQTLEELSIKLKDLDLKKSVFKDSLMGKSKAIIAEIKKASPSAGVISEDFDPVLKAKEYESFGASALSILTEEDYFQGSIQYLIDVKAKTYLPILRKDFIIDEYQIYQSKLYGADCILLIVSALSDSQLKEFKNIAESLDLDVLVEIHNQAELERIQPIDFPFIGINNRNLSTFEVDLKTTKELSLNLKDKLIVSESGIKTREDIDQILNYDVLNFLVGESFMRAENPGTELRKLFFSPE